MPTLHGEKVFLRAVEKKDIQSALKWFNDAEVIQYLQFYLPLTELAEEKWIERISLSEKDTVFQIEAKTSEEGSKAVGICGLHQINWKDRSATFGIAIGEKDFWNGGYGTEAAGLLIEYAFCQLNLRRTSSLVYDFNERSLGMHRKLGFEIEGRRRQAIFKNNRYADEVILGLLKEEWKK